MAGVAADTCLDVIMAHALGKRSLSRAALTFAVAFMAWSGQASAMDSCVGTIGALLLSPMPAKPVVRLDIGNPAPRAQKMAARFMEGLKRAGIPTGPHPNVSLRVTTARFDQTPPEPAPAQESDGSDLSGLAGGVPMAMPPMPSSRVTQRPAAVAPPMLFMRVEALPTDTKRAAWIATLQCRIAGTDDGQRAEDLGHLVGGLFGQRLERRLF
jgi:hypothetical protein